ncbi:MAG: endolytic transglycosylase MltG [Firmicutes bacterium]|nr:endolytic transglycosylase MltG [Bacillota bacterium]
MDLKKKILIAVICVAVIIVAGAVFYITGLGKALDSNDTQTVSVIISSGSSTGQIGQILEEEGIISSADKFKIWSRIKGYDSRYKAGTYTLSPSMDFQKIADIIVSGKVTTVNFTIPEGYTIYQTASAIAAKGLGDYDTLVSLIEAGDFEYDFLKDAQNNKNKLEGYLFPNTYTVDEGMNEEQIIKVMLDQFEKQPYKVYAESGSSYSLNDIITVASIIERECKVDEERPLVASVIYNRLAKGMPLQMCSTVQYVLGKQKEVLTYADTRIESPYNTYTNTGLPPGPICSPGLAAIKAALNPADTDYLYFVLSEKLDGTSNFSSDYAQFEKDKAAYDKAYRAAH